MNYPIQEHQHDLFGVPGRMLPVHAPQLIRGRMVHRNQTWVSLPRPIAGYGASGSMAVRVRFDDECKNGRQSFSITADVTTRASRARSDVQACGCLHDDIAIVFPELTPLIKWHLFDTNGPMHYISNTVYHATNRHNGKLKGEVSRTELRIAFEFSPFTHAFGKSFLEWTRTIPRGGFTIEEVQHDKHGVIGEYQFLPHYSFAGYTVNGAAPKWHECPFKDKNQAKEYELAFNNLKRIYTDVPTEYSPGKERDLAAARNAACWPEATDEQLMLEAPELTALLEARLPGLIAEFRAVTEQCGFLWEPETPAAAE